MIAHLLRFFPPTKESTYAALSDCTHLYGVEADTLVPRNQEKLLLSNLSQPRNIGLLLVKHLLQVNYALSECFEAVHQVFAYVSIEKEGHATLSRSSNWMAASTSFWSKSSHFETRLILSFSAR
jgi:hypothetical protein